MFNRPLISDHYRNILSELEKTVQRCDSKFILEKSTDEIVDYFLNSDYILQPIEFDTDKKETMKHIKEMRRIPANSRSGSFRGDGDQMFECESINVTLPIIPNKTISIIKGLHPSTFTLSWSTKDIGCNSDYISFSIDVKGYGFKSDDNKIVNDIASWKKRIQEWVGWVNSDIEKGIATLKKDIIPFINNRKQKLTEDGSRMGSLSEKLGFKLEE